MKIQQKISNGYNGTKLKDSTIEPYTQGIDIPDWDNNIFLQIVSFILNIKEFILVI